MAESESSHPRPRSRFLRLVGILAILFVVAVGVAPQVIAKTPLLHWLLSRLVPDDELQAKVESASLGWFSPFSLNGLTIRDREERLFIEVERVGLNRSWFQTLLNLPDVGRITLSRPRVSIVIPSQLDDVVGTEFEWRSSIDAKNTFSARVQDASFSVRLEGEEQPAIEIETFNASVEVRQAGDHREFAIPPLTIFDRQKLTPALIGQGLQLVAPVLADATRMEGSVSLVLDEVRIPLDVSPEQQQQDMRIEGSLAFHDVTMGLKNPLMLEITRILSTVLQRKVPNNIKVAKNTAVHFRVEEGRVHHEGFSLVLPEISEDMVITTSGSVGLDETLDLTLQIPLPLALIANRPILQRISEKPLVLQVKGTLDDPRVELPADGNWINEFVHSFQIDGSDPEKAAAQAADITSDLLDVLRGVIDQRREDGEAPATPLLDQFRNRRDELRSSEEENGDRPSRRRWFPGRLLRRQSKPPAQENEES